MSSKPTLTIVLPCFNPTEGWSKQVVRSMNSIDEGTRDVVDAVFLIIVNDGSTKNVTKAEKAFILENITKCRFIEYGQNKGKGYALRKGVSEATSDLIIYTDIDFPYEEESLVQMTSSLAAGNEVVLGHRGHEYYEKTPWFRKAVSKTLRWVLKAFLRLPTDDSQCGLKGYNQNGATVFLETKIDRFLFDLEFIKLASKRKMKIALIDAQLKPNVVFSKVSPRILIREFFNFLRVLVRK